MARLNGISETALYVEDMRRSLDFYERVLGLAALHTSERLSALRVAPGQVLLLITKGADTEPTVLPFGTLPPSDGRGELHVAFAIATDRLSEWRGALEANGVEIESAIDPGFPIWLWYFCPSDQSSRLDLRGFHSMNPDRMGDTQWVRKKPSPFSSASTGF